jgi:hypothetical protein
MVVRGKHQGTELTDEKGRGADRWMGMGSSTPKVNITTERDPVRDKLDDPSYSEDSASMRVLNKLTTQARCMSIWVGRTVSQAGRHLAVNSHSQLLDPIAQHPGIASEASPIVHPVYCLPLGYWTVRASCTPPPGQRD